MDRTTYDQPVSSGEESDVLIQSPVWGGDSESSEKQTPLTLYTVFLTLFAAIGGFLFGYDTGVISGAMILIKDTFSLSSFWQELVVSVTIGTSIIGALLGGCLNHQFGRRPVLILSAAVFTAGAVTMGVAHSREILLLGRLIVGFGIGKYSYHACSHVFQHTHTHNIGGIRCLIIRRLISFITEYDILFNPFIAVFLCEIKHEICADMNTIRKQCEHHH